MPLSPIDIKNKTFGKSFGGYNREEVKAFLVIVSKEIEDLRNERIALAQKVDELSIKLAQYEKTETLLKETLITAQKATTDIRENTKKECELIINKAKADAEQIKKQALEQIQKLQDKINELESQKFTLLNQLKSLISTINLIVERELTTKDKTQKP